MNIRNLAGLVGGIVAVESLLAILLDYIQRPGNIHNALAVWGSFFVVSLGLCVFAMRKKPPGV
jgi:hypothetical protein